MKLTITTYILCTYLTSCASTRDNLNQYGSMHEAIGQNKSQSRVLISSLLQNGVTTGVGAIEGLSGELTIVDGEAVVTNVYGQSDNQYKLSSVYNDKATLFIGSKTKQWESLKVTSLMTKVDFEKWLEEKITSSKHEEYHPFAFKIKGVLTKARMHVINGACPLHAKMKGIRLKESQLPFKKNFEQINAVVVGIFAKHATGNLTHPNTNIHAHIVYTGKENKRFTGHLEDFTISSGSEVLIPKL